MGRKSGQHCWRVLSISALLISMAGCGSQSPPVGDALSYGGDEGKYCQPAVTGSSDATYALDSVKTTDRVVFKGVELVKPDNLQVDDSFILPIVTGAKAGGLGVSAVWPPAQWQTQYFPELKLKELEGQSIDPQGLGKSASQYNIVVHIKILKLPASFSRVRIFYAANGNDYFQDNSTALTITQTCAPA